MSHTSPGPRPVGLPDDLVWPVRMDRTGESGPTRAQARSKAWRRSSQGLYVPSNTPHSVEQRIVEAGALLPSYGAITGWAALRWLGGTWFDGTDTHGLRPVTLALMDSSVRARPGVAISEERLDPTQIVPHAGIRVTTAAYALLFEIRHATTDREALVWADMAAYSDLVSRAELSELAHQCPGWDGIGRGRTTADAMNENAWSPPEVDMRTTWVDRAGRPRPLTNRPVFDLDGRLIGTPDLIDPAAGVAGEYDSELHLERTRRRKDVEREHRFQAVGLETVAMVTGEITEPAQFIERLHAAYARAARRSAADRRWTIEPPSWWTPTFTVEQRRALTEEQKASWLRHRREAG